MSDRFSDRILRFLAQPGYRPVKMRPLARQMGIAEAEYGEFRQAVDALRRVGRVVLGGGNALTLPDVGRRFIGVYRANPRGFGFVVPENPGAHGDLFIPPGHALDAVTGDTVECAVSNRSGRDGKRMTSGRVLRVLQRGYNRFVGQLHHEGGRWYVRPDGHRLHAPIFVADAAARSARAGDQVVVEIIQYPDENRQAKGVIVERLGPRGKPGVDVLGIIRQHQLPDAFPDAVLTEAREVARRFDLDAELKRREDLRSDTIVTIDPDDARDFDDAISLRRLDGDEVRSPARAAAAAPQRRARPARHSQGAWELGVHIADVSHYVRPGSALDREARQRGNSVYFPRHVLPMLPEVLSNGLCSLQEGEPRLCKSAFICFDDRGEVRSARFAETVIRSTRRLTYREAQAVIDGRSGGFPREIVSLLQRMNALATIIQQRRLAAGQIVLDLPEIELVLDDDNRVVDAVPADTSFTHTLIEMFMVEANEAVARLLDSRRVPFLRRIHPEPDDEGRETLTRFLRVAGHHLPRRLEREDLQRLLRNLRGRPEAYAINLAVLKSMEQAVYSPKREGHYALASGCYTHFTSPIRRYTDLTVHRLLAALASEERASPAKRAPRAAREAVEHDLDALGRHLSFTERRAADAERELKELKVLELLAKHIGDAFDGVVTGVANFGLFVQHPRFLIDGLLPLEALPDDYWNVDARAGRVVGQRTRRTFAIGAVVRVLIDQVDLPARQLRLGLVSGGTQRRHAKTRSSPRAERRRR